jgi:hypothetical protein
MVSKAYRHPGKKHRLAPSRETAVDDSINKADQLQRRAMPGSKPELLIMQQAALVYFSEDPS